MGYDEIARLLGISRRRVCQIEDRAMAKMRDFIEANPDLGRALLEEVIP